MGKQGARKGVGKKALLCRRYAGERNAYIMWSIECGDREGMALMARRMPSVELFPVRGISLPLIKTYASGCIVEACIIKGGL